MEFAKYRWVFITALLTFFMALQPALSQTPLPWQTGNQPQQPSQPQDNSLHSINGIPLFIDGTQTKNIPVPLAPDLLYQVKNVTTLGDALRILGPAYIAPDDNLHIAHWHFQDGTMLTLWPQGGESINDTVSVSPRPDCGVAPSDCKDLVLNRKKAQQQQRSGGGGRGGSGGSSSLLSPLMKMVGR